MKPHCCIYCRIDGQQNEQNQRAMNRQLEMLRAAAVVLDLSVAAETTVFESGISPLRQSIKTLIRDARHGLYDCILVTDPSRLARSTEGLHVIGEKMNRHGIRIYTPDGPILLAKPRVFFYARRDHKGGEAFGSGE